MLAFTMWLTAFFCFVMPGAILYAIIKQADRDANG